MSGVSGHPAPAGGRARAGRGAPRAARAQQVTTRRCTQVRVPGTGGTVYGTGGFPYPGSRDGGMSDAVAKPEESDAGSASDAMTSEVGAVEPTSTLDASRDGETGE